MTAAEPLDREVRLRAFDFLSEQTLIPGDVLPWLILSAGFLFNGTRVPLVGPQGIFKPAMVSHSIGRSILSLPAGTGHF